MQPVPTVIEFEEVPENIATIMNEVGAKPFQSKGSDGVTAMGFALALTPVALRLVDKAIREYLQYRKALVVKAAGIELRGYASDDATKIITALENVLKSKNSV
jgi:hypothetical protein